MNRTAQGSFYSPRQQQQPGQDFDESAYSRGRSAMRKAPKYSRRDIPRQLVEPVDQREYPEDNFQNEFTSIPGPNDRNFSNNNAGNGQQFQDQPPSRNRFGGRNSPQTESSNHLRRNTSPRFDINRKLEDSEPPQSHEKNFIPRRGQLTEPSMHKNQSEMTNLERDTKRVEEHLLKTQLERDELKSRLDKLERNGRRTGRSIRERRDLEEDYNEKQKYVNILKKNLRELKK